MEVVPREIAHEGEVLLQVRTSLTKQKASLHDTNTYILLIELPFFFHFYASFMLFYADLFFQGMDLGIDESGSSRSRRGSRIAPGTIIFTAPPDHLDFSCFSIIVMHCVRLIVVFLVFELGFHFFTLLLYCKLGLADGLGPEEESFKNGRSSSRRNSKRIGDGNT